MPSTVPDVEPLSPWLWAALVSGPAAVALFWLASLAPSLVERWYSRGLFALLNPLWARTTALVPFPLIEIVFVLLLLGGIALWWLTPRAWLYELAVVSVLVAWFVLGWGLNYQRLPWAASQGLVVTGGTVADLEGLAGALASEANLTRTVAQPTAESATTSPPVWRTLIPEAKPALSSPLMSWMGIAGIYMPWTAEPLVNAGPPAWQLPFTAAHERNHQRGWAREDEANFLAWKDLSESSDPRARYAAALGALPFVAGALLATGEKGQQAWQRVSLTLAPEVREDWRATQEWWKQFAGPVQTVSQAVNDTYLKAQGQTDGVKSYGRMVDLLLAWRKR